MNQTVRSCSQQAPCTSYLTEEVSTTEHNLGANWQLYVFCPSLSSLSIDKRYQPHSTALLANLKPCRYQFQQPYKGHAREHLVRPQSPIIPQCKVVCMPWWLIMHACNLQHKARESLYFACRRTCGVVLTHINILGPSTGLRSESFPTRLCDSHCSWKTDRYGTRRFDRYDLAAQILCTHRRQVSQPVLNDPRSPNAPRHWIASWPSSLLLSASGVGAS
jgi:hypothetical protein